MTRVATGCRPVRVAAPGSRTEREADRIAEAVVAGEPARGQGAATEPRVIHRACAACSAGGQPCSTCADEALQLSRSAVGRASPATGATQEAAAAVGQAGTALPPALRRYFEPRFGTDLGGVRLHDDNRTGAAARGIGARAYALGSDIGFAPGAYAPATGAGRRLIAHELAHTLAADGRLHRQPAEDEEEAPRPPRDIVRPIPNVHSETFEDDAGGGGTTFEELLEEEPTRAGSHIQGDVRRREIAPRTDEEDREVIADHTALVDFNTSSCEVRLPYRFGFREYEDDPRGNHCQGDPVTGDVDIDAIASDYVDAVNAGLNDQFKVRLSDCDHPCAGRDLPIRVMASRDDNEPDRRIRVIRRGGFGSSYSLCAGDFDLGFPVHEAGHQVLGMGDEYLEEDADDLERHPEAGRRERVRHDYNWMGERRQHGRFNVFHERHFRHVQTFLNHVMRPCRAELVEVPKRILSFRPFAHFGLGEVAGGLGGRLSGGLDVGVPLTRGRQWQLVVGAQADYLAQLDFEARRFVLAGMRLGFERQFHGEEASFRLFGTGRLGVSHELGREESALLGADSMVPPPRTSAFGEAEIGGGVLLGGPSAFTADLRLTGGGELSGHPDAAYWITVGIGLGGRF